MALQGTLAEGSNLASATPSTYRNDRGKSPNLSNCLVFIDENEYTLLDSQFGMPTDSYNGSQTWWDMPSNRHNQGGNLAFADGHAVRWKWVVPKRYTTWIQSVPPEEMPDWLRIKASVKQTMD